MSRAHRNSVPAPRRRPLLLSALVSAALLVLAGSFAGPAQGAGGNHAKPTLPGLTGLANVGGAPLVGARVRVYTARAVRRPAFTGRSAATGSAASTHAPWFTHQLALAKPLRTNRLGGFTSAARGLPRHYLVQLTGGTVKGRPSRATLYAVGDASERGVIVNPVTTAAAAYAKLHPALSPRAASRRIRQLLGVPQMPGGAMALGHSTDVESMTFSPTLFLAAANRRGGVDAFSRRLARLAADPSARVSYRRKDYQPATRPGYPTSNDGATRRSTSRATATAASSSLSSSILSSVLKNVLYNGSCDLIGPSLPSNLLCGGGNGSSDVLNAVNALNSSLLDIENTLTAMQTQADESNAQAQYAVAYAFAGVDTVNTAVGAASVDLSVIASNAPTGTSGFAAVPSASTNSAYCGAVYSPLYTTGDTYDMCTDFLAQAATFTNSPTDYFSAMYEALTGANNQPSTNLLTYTYQQVLTNGGDFAVPQADVAAVQDNLAQIVQLQDNAFSLVANAQTFTHMVTTDEQPSCPDTTTSGNFPSSTVPDIADVCETTETSLFEASVENTMGAKVTVPPAGSVADPRSNYVWWGYPVDLSKSTTSSGSYPFMPGAPSGTYSVPGGVIAVAKSTTGVPIFAAAPQYAFTFANTAEAQSITKGLAIPSGGTVNSALNAIGFTGLGTSQYGLAWNDLGVSVNANGYSTTSEWNSGTHYAFIDCGDSYVNISGSFQCSSIEVNGGYSTPTYGVLIEAPLATQYFALTGTSVASSPSTCGSIAYSSSQTTPTPNTTGSGVKYCQANTYGLLVDTSPPPAFWTTAMLTGMTAGTVPALDVPAP